MRSLRRAAAGLSAFSAFLALPSLAQTVTVVYEPAASSVPTLSNWGLIAMVGLMAVAVFVTVRRGALGRLFSLFAAAAALTVTASQLATPAVAAPDFALANAAGGTTVWGQTGTTPLPNTTTTALRIVSVQAAQDMLLVEPEPSPRCVAGLVVSPGQTCYVTVIPLTIPTSPGSVD